MCNSRLSGGIKWPLGARRWRIVHQPKRGFVRAVPKRESPSRPDLRWGLNPEQRCLFNVHALTTGGQKEKVFRMGKATLSEWSQCRASRQCSLVGAWWLGWWLLGRVRGGEWQASDQNEAGRHLHREQAAEPKNTKLEYETEPR